MGQHDIHCDMCGSLMFSDATNKWHKLTCMIKGCPHKSESPNKLVLTDLEKDIAATHFQRLQKFLDFFRPQCNDDVHDVAEIERRMQRLQERYK